MYSRIKNFYCCRCKSTSVFFKLKSIQELKISTVVDSLVTGKRNSAFCIQELKISTVVDLRSFFYIFYYFSIQELKISTVVDGQAVAFRSLCPTYSRIKNFYCCRFKRGSLTSLFIFVFKN